MLYKIFTSIGLFLDILGVILLFRYGLPSKIIGPPRLLISENVTEEEEIFNKEVKKWAYV